MTLVLSGTGGLVLSGTQGSSYQEPKSLLNPHICWSSGPLNNANSESFGFLLTSCAAAGAWGWRCANDPLPALEGKAKTGTSLHGESLPCR
jgi:hypothetical protein